MKKLSVKIKIILLVFLAIQISSCSYFDKRPKIVEEALTKKINEESAGYIKLVDFKKIDGQEIEIDGYKGYVLEYNGFIQFQKDCYRSSGFVTTFDVFKSKPTGWDAYNSGGLKECKKGLKICLYGKAKFKKMESGWSLVDLNIIASKDGNIEPVDGDVSGTDTNVKEQAKNENADSQKVKENLPPIDYSKLNPNENGDGEEPNINQSGIVKSLNYQGNNYLEIEIISESKSIKVWCSRGRTVVFKDNKEKTWADIIEGAKISVNGKFETTEGQQQLNADGITIL